MRRVLLVIAPDAAAAGEVPALFAAGGHEIVVTDNATDALARLQAGPYDGIVIDFPAPSLEGIGLCFAVRQQAALEHLPVVLLEREGSDGVMDRELATLAGADACLRPPIDPMQLAAALSPRRGAAARREVAAHGDTIAELARFCQALLDRLRERDLRRQQLEAQFRQAQKMESIGRLSGGVAHDFNNLLTVILGRADALRHRPDASPDVAEAAGEIHDAATRASHLAQQLLVLSRRQEVHLRAVDLGDVVSRMSRLLGRIVGAGVAIDFVPPGHALPICADAGMLEQILLNLVVNARDAMPEGGRITITTETVDVRSDTIPPVAAGAVREGRFGRLTVTDTGVGIAPEVLPRIFEPFFTTKDAGKGSGLGLATVHDIVEQLHGWIEVESAPDAGAGFRVCLPLAPEVGDAAAAEVEAR